MDPVFCLSQENERVDSCGHSVDLWKLPFNYLSVGPGQRDVSSSIMVVEMITSCLCAWHWSLEARVGHNFLLLSLTHTHSILYELWSYKTPLVFLGGLKNLLYKKSIPAIVAYRNNIYECNNNEQFTTETIIQRKHIRKQDTWIVWFIESNNHPVANKTLGALSQLWRHKVVSLAVAAAGCCKVSLLRCCCRCCAAS